MKLNHYDDDLSADDFTFEEKRKKMNQFKEKKNIKAISLEMLPIENDMEIK